jgi:hypothetical protein
MLDDYMEIVIRPLYSVAWTYLNERLVKAQEDQRQRDAQAAEMLELAQSITRH